MEQKILAIIPARGGSKGVPRKNIRDLNGKPLIAYTIEEAKKSKYIDRVVVSTEDIEIANVSKDFGAEVPCLRPEELSRDNSPTADCILHMINYLNTTEGYYPDYICLLQCTSPLRSVKDIDMTIETALKRDVDGAVSVCEAEVNPYWTNIIENGKLKYFIEEGKNITRRQDLPDIYRINGAVYVIKTQIFKENKTFETDNIAAYIMSALDSVDIDTEIDFKLAEIIMRERDNHA